jgi:hypothetical protein
VSAFCRFIDSFGFEWQAFEVATTSKVPGHHERKVLYFCSRGETRVAQAYPADWTALTWTDLEDLCANASEVRRDGPVSMHPELRPRPSAV